MGTRWLKVLLVLLFVPLACLADVINIKDTAPKTYIVEKGDTLWDISNMYLEKPWLWPELWRNNTHIENPHLIYPGDELHLRINEQGEAVLELVREAPKTQIKLTPQGRKNLKEPEPIPALPWSVIKTYVEKDMVMTEEEYGRLPHLLGNMDGAVRFATGDLVLSKGSRRRHSAYRVIRKQNELIDLNGNLLGVQIRHVADATPIPASLKNEVLVQVEQANFEAKRGDKLLPERERMPVSLELQPADKRQKGHIVGSLEQHTLLGKYDVVVLDLGEREIDAGTVMGIYLQGPSIVDGEAPKYETENNFLRSAFATEQEIEQPAHKVGELVVFKVFDNASYGLITRSTKIVKYGAIVASP